MTNPPRAAIYTRVSTAGQEEDGSSLGTQEARCRQYAAERGYTVEEAHVYRETHSGLELWQRRQLTTLREAVRRHEVEVVVAYAIDRLSRDPVHLGVIISEAEYAGVPVEFVTEPLDDTDEGQLVRYIRGYAAKVEHEKIKERAMRGKLARVQSGRLMPGCRVRYGYRWRDETRSSLEPDEPTARVVRRIFREALEGVPLRSIAARLTADGIPTATGGSPVWRHSSVVQILTDPLYTGQAAGFRHQKQGQSGRKRQGRYRPEEEQIAMPAGTVPALVDAEAFNDVQRQLQRNKERAARNNRNPEGALLRGGLVRCAYCGNSMIVLPRRDTGRDVYACANRVYHAQHGSPRPSIQVRILDAEIMAKVNEWYTDDNVIAAALAENLAEDTTAADLLAVERELAAVDRKRRNLVAQLEDLDPVSARATRERLAALAEQTATLEAERGAILARRQAWEAAQTQLQELEAWRRAFVANTQLLSYQERRRAIEGLNLRIKVRGIDHYPRWEAVGNAPIGAHCVQDASKSCTPPDIMIPPAAARASRNQGRSSRNERVR